MSNFKEHDSQVPGEGDWAQVKREHDEAKALQDTEKRQYRALAMELAVKMCAGQYPSLSPMGLQNMTMDLAKDYFGYIWDGR